MSKGWFISGLSNFFVRICCAVIRFYQICISPLFPACCRYRPTCSRYAIEALQKYGLITGLWLAFRRILRCSPLYEGGFDPVP